MNKKILIVIVLIIFIIIALIFAKSKKTSNSQISEEIQKKKPEIVSVYDEETNIYIIKDESTGEILYTTQDEASAEEWEDFYKENPDYRSSRLSFGDIEENSEEYTIEY